MAIISDSHHYRRDQRSSKAVAGCGASRNPELSHRAPAGQWLRIRGRTTPCDQPRNREERCDTWPHHMALGKSSANARLTFSLLLDPVCESALRITRSSSAPGQRWEAMVTTPSLAEKPVNYALPYHIDREHECERRGGADRCVGELRRQDIHTVYECASNGQQPARGVMSVFFTPQLRPPRRATPTAAR